MEQCVLTSFVRESIFQQLHLSANAQLTSHFSTLEKYRSFDRLEDLEA